MRGKVVGFRLDDPQLRFGRFKVELPFGFRIPLQLIAEKRQFPSQLRSTAPFLERRRAAVSVVVDETPLQLVCGVHHLGKEFRFEFVHKFVLLSGNLWINYRTFFNKNENILYKPKFFIKKIYGLKFDL